MSTVVESSSNINGVVSLLETTTITTKDTTEHNNNNNQNTNNHSIISNNTTSTNTNLKWIASEIQEQSWQSIGMSEDERIGATSNFDCMVDQLTSILSERLLNLILSRTDHPIHEYTTYDHDANKNKTYDTNTNSHCNYKLNSNIQKSLRSYVARIGSLYRNVYYHNFEHAVHVTISANKLVTMIIDATNKPTMSSVLQQQQQQLQQQEYEDEYDHQQQLVEDGDDPAAEEQGQQQQNGTHRHHQNSNLSLQQQQQQLLNSQQNGNSNHSGNNYNNPNNHDITFGISSNALIQFAVVFSALIHDVDHQGVPNATLVDEEDPLSIMHNDISVAEQHSLQLAFSILTTEDEFKDLKKCIMPCKQSRKEFRKIVIDIVLVTDISNPERMQISQSKWEAAFPSKDLNHTNSSSGDSPTGACSIAEDEDLTDEDDSHHEDDEDNDESLDLIGDSLHSTSAADSILEEEDRNDLIDELLSEAKEEIEEGNIDTNHMNKLNCSANRALSLASPVVSKDVTRRLHKSTAAIFTGSKDHFDNNNNNNESFDDGLSNVTPNISNASSHGEHDSVIGQHEQKLQQQMSVNTSSTGSSNRNKKKKKVRTSTKSNTAPAATGNSSGMVKGGALNPRSSITKRHSMYTSNRSYRKIRREQLGLRQSLDLGGKMINIYESNNEGEMKLRRHSVLDTLITVADVAHTMQSFEIFVKWNKRLFKELLYAYHNDRIEWDPTVGWYANQICFYDKYIIPLAKKMDECGVFGQGKSSIFLLLALENKRKWQVDGLSITNNLVEEIGKELITQITNNNNNNNE